MARTYNPDPLQLFHRLQSKRLSLPKRLRAVGQLAKKLDTCFCQTNCQGETTATSEDALLSQPATVYTKREEPPVKGLAATTPFGGVTLAEAMQLLQAANQIVRGQLLPRLPRYHVRFAEIETLSEAQLVWLQGYFQRSIYPVLTPFAVDPAHPFPRVAPGSLYFLVTLRAFGQLCRLQNGHLTFHMTQQPPVTSPPTNTYPETYMDEREVYGLVNLSGVGSRLVRLEADGVSQAQGPTLLLWREEIIRHFISSLFVGMEVTGVYQFRILRANRPAPVTQVDQSLAINRPVPLRVGRLPVVHIDVEQGMPDHLVQWLVTHLHTSGDCVLPCVPPLAMADFDELANYLSNQ